MAITHLTVGSNDLEKSRKFYDAALAPLGLKRLHDMPHGYMYGENGPELMVIKPRDGAPATRGNGFTVGFAAPNRAAVDEFHKQALANGGVDEGAPGPRDFAPNAYCAYARCPDGHKLVAVSMGGV